MHRQEQSQYAGWPPIVDIDHLGMDQACRLQLEQSVESLSRRFTYSGAKPFPFGLPLIIKNAASQELVAFAAAYHRMLKSILAGSSRTSLLQEFLSLPGGVADLLKFDTDACTCNDVHICRLDLYTTADGGFKVLETNANCPGGLIYAGFAAKALRPFIEERLGVASLPYASDSWMADWYVRAARRATGQAPRRVVLLREKGGHRLELDEHSLAFQRLGIGTVECDPRDLASRDGRLCIDGEAVDFAYHKISFVELEKMRPQSDRYAAAVGSGRIFVQNGLRARTVCDSKLCLAVMAEPAFHHLFDAGDLAIVLPHLAWARNGAFLDSGDASHVASSKDDYVLKKPLDTRGRGEVVGREASAGEWARALEEARRDGWLVMQYIEPTRLPATDGGEPPRHDLALALIDGAIEGGYSRSSRDLKVNVAQNGRLHPLFMAAA